MGWAAWWDTRRRLLARSIRAHGQSLTVYLVDANKPFESAPTHQRKEASQ